MKKFEFIVAALALVAGVMFCSCVKDETDMLPLHDQHQIDFTASSDAEWLNATRADEEKEPQVMILEMEGDEDLEQPLYLHITCEDRKEPTAEELGMEATRGNIVTTDNFAQKFGKSGFGIFAYVYKGDWNDSRTSDYIHNDTVRYHENTGKWHIHYYTNEVNGKPMYTPTDYYYWPGKNYNVRFFAYAPHDTGYKSCMDFQDTPYTGAPSIDFTLSNNNINQFDFCVAKTDQVSGDYNKTLALNFKHALTAIDFVADATMPKGTISNIWFINIMRKDNYNFETERWAGTELYADKNRRNVSFKSDFSVALTGGKEQKITDTSTNSTFFMIPHTLGNDATMRIHYIDPAGTEHKLTVSLKGTTWEMGKHYTYKISPNPNSITHVLKIEQLTDDVYNEVSTISTTYKGTFARYYVTSYINATLQDGYSVSQQPVGWDVKFSVDDGKTWVAGRPEMFKNFTTQGNGGVRIENGVSIAPVKGVYYKVGTTTVDPNADPFKGVSAVSGTVDLSMVSGTRNTANCYIVNKPGKYKLPLVYGNAIKDDDDNESSYKPGNTADGTLANFLDHNDKVISSPFIANNMDKDVPTDAVLVYSDEPDLVTNVKLSTSTESILGNAVKFIEFEVPEDFITIGNAIIAVRDADGDIMWSWHIWVTNYTGATTNIKGYNNVTYSLMNQCLGYCPGKRVGWPGRKVIVRFTQRGEGGLVKDIVFNQAEKAIETRTANQPYYQWGRKDPMLAFCCATTAAGTSDSDKPCYYSNSKYNYRAEASRTSGVTIGKAIQTPYIFYGRSTDNRDWCSNEDYLNRWDATITTTFGKGVWETDNTVIKTIYDPSPAGFCVPTKNVYAKVIEEDSNLSLNKNYDTFGSGMISVMGLNFCTTGDRSRYTGAAWYAVGHTQGSYWTATPRKQTYNTCANWILLEEKVDENNNIVKVIEMSALAMSSGFVVKSMVEK